MTPAQLDGFHEECGVFGVYGTDEANVLTALGLHALQHRGQEAAGIVTFDGSAFHAHRAQRVAPGVRRITTPKGSVS